MVVADRGWAINNTAKVLTAAPAVKVSASSIAPAAWEGDLLFVPLFMAQGEDKRAHAPVVGNAAAVDAASGGVISELVADNEFKGSGGSSATVRMGGASKVKKLCIVGAGKADKFDVKGGMKVGDSVAVTAKAEKARKVAVVMPVGASKEIVEALVSSVLEGLYHDVRFKSGDDVEKPARLEELELLQVADAASAIDMASMMEAGARLTKDLVSAPANYVTPSFLAETAAEMAEELGMTCKILEKDECVAKGMGPTSQCPRERRSPRS